MGQTSQLTASIQPSDTGQPRQVRIVIGETILLLSQAGASMLGTQLIGLAAIAKAQDEGAAIKTVDASSLVIV